MVLNDSQVIVFYFIMITKQSKLDSRLRGSDSDVGFVIPAEERIQNI